MTLKDIITESADGKRLLISFLFFAVMLYLIDFSAIGTAELARITDGGKILDMEHGYSVDKAYTMLEYLGETGRQFYLTKIIPLDSFFPISLMLFNLSLLAGLLKKTTKTGSPFRWLLLLPLADMMCDWAENIGFARMLMNFPERMETLCRFNSIITHCKLTSIMLIYISVAVLFTVSVIQKIRSKKKQIGDCCAGKN